MAMSLKIENTEIYQATALPRICRIDTEDLREVLILGFKDFWAAPTHLIFLGLVYPIVGLMLSRFAFGYRVLPLLFPLVAGFALIGPLAALGIYELSRRRERDLPVRFADAVKVFRSPPNSAILVMAVMMLALFMVWLTVAQWLYQNCFSTPPASIADFAERLTSTPAGWTLIIAGNGIGFLFAVAAMCISVISFPMLLDRPVSAVTAVETSVRAVMANPVAMAKWGLIVAAALMLGTIPLLVGLAVVVPVLGHATWHLYRKLVA
jgi:uncharacterized membrane protein